MDNKTVKHAHTLRILTFFISYRKNMFLKASKTKAHIRLMMKLPIKQTSEVM